MSKLFEKYEKPMTIEEAYAQIRENVAMVDGSAFGILSVTGGGAADYLDGIITRDIKYLSIDTVSEGLVLDENAKALGNVYVCRMDEDFVVLTPPGSEKAAAAILGGSADDVKIADVSAEKDLMFFEGPRSYAIVREVMGVDVDTLPLRGIQSLDSYTVMRIGRSGEYAYAVLGEKDSLAGIIDKAVEFAQGQDFTLAPTTEEAMEVCMLETAQPNFARLDTEEYNLFELCIQWFIQYEKENYTGRDAMMELFGREHARESVFFVCLDGLETKPGDKVLLEDEEIGVVTQCAYCPKKGAVIGLAVLKAELAVSGVVYSVGSGEIETVSSPVVRPLSWDQPIS